MSDEAKERARIWFKDPEGWSRSVASDVLALEQRVAALEGNRPATPDSSPAADGDALRAECERLCAENAALRQRLAAPIDVEAFRPEFEKLVLNGPFSIARDVGGFYESLATCLAWLAVTAFASRLNVAARKEATPGQPTQSATG